jgi:hypothetical protein
MAILRPRASHSSNGPKMESHAIRAPSPLLGLSRGAALIVAVFAEFAKFPDFLRFFYAQLSAASRSAVSLWISQIGSAREHVAMNTYSAVEHDFQSARVSSFGNYWHRCKPWFGAYLSARSRRKTEKLLASLDRSILEDLGVPHDNVSPTAGVLDRYPRVITVKPRGI